MLMAKNFLTPLIHPRGIEGRGEQEKGDAANDSGVKGLKEER